MEKSESQPVYDILERIEMSAEDRIYMPAWKGRPLEGFRDYKDRRYVTGLNHRQSILLGQELSKKVGSMLTLLPLQASYDEASSSRKFRSFMEQYWIHNAEVILGEGAVLPLPRVEEREGRLFYAGDGVKAEIKQNAVDTLVAADIFKEHKNKVFKGEIFFDSGEASVRSHWLRDWGAGYFFANADPPRHRYDYGVAAFRLVEPSERFRLVSSF